MLDVQTFWKYAVNLYGLRGVTNVCLTLQDNLGLNVNLLLLLCYAEKHHLQLSGQDIETLAQSVDRWHQQYTHPLRLIRRQLALDDGAPTAAKRATFDAEMELEKVEQKLLVTAFNQLQPTVSQSAQNLQRYIGRNDNKAPITYAGAIKHLRKAQA